MTGKGTQSRRRNHFVSTPYINYVYAAVLYYFIRILSSYSVWAAESAASDGQCAKLCAASKCSSGNIEQGGWGVQLTQ